MNFRNFLPLIRIDWLLLAVLLVPSAPAMASTWLDCEVEAAWLSGRLLNAGDNTVAALIQVNDSTPIDGFSHAGECIETGAQMIALDASPGWENLTPNTPVRLRYHVYSAMGPQGVVHRESWYLLEKQGAPAVPE